MRVLLLAPMGSVHRQHNKANIAALRAIGAEISLMANFDTRLPREKQNAEFVDYCQSNGISIIDIPFRRGGFLLNLFYIPKAVSVIKAQRFDVIHVHTETGGLFLRIAKIFIPSNTVFLYTIHGMSFWKGSSIKSQVIYRPLERWICSGMDMNIGINQEEYNTLCNWNNKTATYVHGVGIDISIFQNPKRTHEEVRKEFIVNDGDIFIVSVGELDDNKNHISVIKALSRLKDLHFKYVICGVGPNKDILLDEAKKLGISDRIILAGYRTDVSDILNAADLFVFPSFHEGLPVSALEAMACGLPIICSSIRGNVDIVRDGDNGFLFSPSDVSTLASKLDYMINHVIERSQMGDKNREIVKSYSISAVTHELISIYSRYYR